MEGLWEMPDDSSEDYLQDPDLWLDRLPQPFRMIDGLLQELLSRTWEAIETRELQRETERTRVRIPKAIAERTLEGARGVCAIQAVRDLVFLGCLDRLSVFTAKDEELTYLSTSSAVTSLAVECMDDIHIIAAYIESGSTVLLACIRPPSGARLIQLADISNQEDNRQISALQMAPSCSHIALITHIDSKEYQVVCYQLSKSAWKQELTSLLEKDDKTTQMVFSKPSFMFTICPPKPFAPSTVSSQHAALLNVFGDGEVIATGENHTLTASYVEKRRRIFESKRPGFTQESAPTSTANRTPTSHFLYFKNGTKQDVPSSLSVWWKTDTQIFLYSLANYKGSSPVLERVITQGSTVCVTAVSCCTRYLAVGLVSGVIVIWDLKTSFCRRVQQVVPPPDIPTALMFYTTSSAPTLAVGTTKGIVLLVKPDLTVISLNQRISKQQEVYKSLFESSGYDSCEIVIFASSPSLTSVAVSIHGDGSVILWSIVDLEALCTVVPPSSCTALPAICTLTTESVFLAVQSHESSRSESTPSSCVRCLHLHSVTHLQRYLSCTIVDSLEVHNDRDTSFNLMDKIQNKLVEINAKIFRDNELFQAERGSKWDEFAKLLQAPS